MSVQAAGTVQASLATEETVRVAVRFRPSSEQERETRDAAARAFFVWPDNRTVESVDRSHVFEFDRVFDENSSQQDVYAVVAQPLVEDLLEGYNATVLSYGQTGSGKTYSMFGPSLHVTQNADNRGVVYRAAQQVFDCIHAGDSDVEYVLRCSLFEVYREQLRDLLDSSNNCLKVKETPSQGIYVGGLVQEFVTCEEDMAKLLRAGSKMRAVAATQLNQCSSRSHVIVSLICEQRRPDGSERSGKLHLVDLAGSERGLKSSSSGVTLEEAKKINLSLSALGNVIKALSEKRPHVPYRDSKLTRILQETLGGNFKTSLITTCSPQQSHYEETVSTLSFALRAKTVSNRVRANVVCGTERLMATEKRLQHELLSTRRAIARHIGKSPPDRVRDDMHHFEWDAALLEDTALDSDRDGSDDDDLSGEELPASSTEQIDAWESDRLAFALRAWDERMDSGIAKTRMWQNKDASVCSSKPTDPCDAARVSHRKMQLYLALFEIDAERALSERAKVARNKTRPHRRDLRCSLRYIQEADQELLQLPENLSSESDKQQAPAICAAAMSEKSLRSCDSVQTVLPMSRTRSVASVERVCLSEVSLDSRAVAAPVQIQYRRAASSSSLPSTSLPVAVPRGTTVVATAVAPMAAVVPTAIGAVHGARRPPPLVSVEDPHDEDGVSQSEAQQRHLRKLIRRRRRELEIQRAQSLKEEADHLADAVQLEDLKQSLGRHPTCRDGGNSQLIHNVGYPAETILSQLTTFRTIEAQLGAFIAQSDVGIAA